MADIILTSNEFFIFAKEIEISKDDISQIQNPLVLKNIYINTQTLETANNKAITGSYSEGFYIRIYINPLIPADEVEFSMKIDGNSYTFKWSATYEDFGGNYSIDRKSVEPMNRDDNSFMLLRTNPKLTGNFKIVVNEKSNLYLDVFKTCPELSKRKYRKTPVSYKDYYGRNIAGLASKFPSYNYVYSLPESSYKLFNVVSEYKDQYVDTYRYGASNNTDKLYSENYSILAPLKIGRIVPDYFIVMKVPGVIDLTESLSDTDIFLSMMKEGKIVKSYDLREGSDIGTYIRNIQSESKGNMLYVSYNTNQFNTYTGITLDKGSVSTIYESPYALKYKNQVQTDNFYTLGYERNGMVADDIVNFEFMFNDDDADLFEINTYFGLYIKMNGNDKPCCCIDGQIMEIDGNTEIPGINYDPDAEDTADTLYCLYDNDCIRLDTELTKCDLSKYNNRFGENILKTSVKELSTPLLQGFSSPSLSYLTMKFNNIVEPGEHFKIIYPRTDGTGGVTEYDIYELIFSNYEKCKENRFPRSIVNIGKSADGSITYKFYRVSVYAEYRGSESASIGGQVESIYKALQQLITDFDAPFKVAHSKDKLSILSDSLYKPQFERITNIFGWGFNTTVENDTITYFNDNFNVTGAEFPDGSDPADVYRASGWEILGNRRYYVVDFKKTMISPGENCYAYEVSFDEKSISDYSDYKYMLIWINGKSYVIDNIGKDDFSFDNPDSRVIFTKNRWGSGIANFYLPYTWNFGISGIFNIKDFNFNVMDGYSDIAMSGEEKKKISDKNNCIDFDILEKDADNIINNDVPSEVITSYVSDTDSVPIYSQITATGVTEKEITVIDGSGANKQTKTVKVYNYDHPSELSMNKYLKFKYDRNVISSSISLTTPYNCKWVATGTDAISNKARLTYNNSLLRYNNNGNNYDGTSFFFPANMDSSIDNANNKLFADIIGFRYVQKIDAGEYKKYYTRFIDSKIDASTTVRDSIYTGDMSIDSLLYRNQNLEDKSSQTYLRGNNTLEFISGGVKFNLKFNSDLVLDLSKYNNYRAIFMVTPGENLYTNSDMEFFINETDRTISFIWHQPVNSLKYAGRNSSGSSIIDDAGDSRVFWRKWGVSWNVGDIFQTNNVSKNICIPTYSYVDSSELSSSWSGFMINLNQDSSVYNFMLDLKDLGCIDKTDTCNVSYIYGSTSSLVKYGSQTSAEPTLIQKDKFVNSIFNKIKRISGITNSYLLSQTADLGYDCKQTYSDLKNMIGTSVVYVKTEKGELKYFDNNWMKLFTASVIDPVEQTFIKTNRTGNLKFFVHPTYFKPAVTDVLNFQYDAGKYISNEFNKNYQLSNIKIDKVKTVDQLWFNKMSENLNYCYNVNKTAFGLGIDVQHDYSILSSTWGSGFYNKYSRDEVQDEYDRKNLAGVNNFIVNESGSTNDVSLYDYLPKVPTYLISNNLDIADVKSNIKLNKEVFNSESYDSSILYTYVDGESSNCVESPNFKKR